MNCLASGNQPAAQTVQFYEYTHVCMYKYQNTEKLIAKKHCWVKHFITHTIRRDYHLLLLLTENIQWHLFNKIYLYIIFTYGLQPGWGSEFLKLYCMHKNTVYHCLRYMKLTGALSNMLSLAVTSWPCFGLINR